MIFNIFLVSRKSRIIFENNKIKNRHLLPKRSIKKQVWDPCSPCPCESNKNSENPDSKIFIVSREFAMVMLEYPVLYMRTSRAYNINNI